MAMALTPYGGWHGEKNSAESWTRRTTHTGDEVGYYEFDQRFEHPGRTWASATHRAFSFACVGAAMANETWKFVQAKSKQAMKQVLGIRGEKTRMKVTPPLAVAPLAQDDGTMEPERRRHRLQPVSRKLSIRVTSDYSCISLVRLYITSA